MIDETAATDDGTAAQLDTLAALRTEVERNGDGAARARLVEGWTDLRERLGAVPAERAADAALLDLAVVRTGLADASPIGDPDLGDRLRAARDAAAAAGLPVEALRAELDLFGREALARACQGALALGPDLAHLTAIVAALADQARTADPATADAVTAAAMSRVADLVLEIAQALDTVLGDTDAADTARSAAVQAAQEAVRAFEAVDPAALDPAAAAAYARAIGIGPFDDAAHGVARLEAALALLPAGTRAVDRAELLRDLGRQLVDIDEPARATDALAESAEEFRRSGDGLRAAACDSYAASLLSRAERHGDAADRLGRTLAALADDPAGVPAEAVLGLHTDHVMALVRAGRDEAAAGAARAVLALLDERPAGHPETAFPAGRAAYAAAVALRAAGERDDARAAARRSADLHGEHLDTLARAEALELAAALADTPADAAALLQEASADADRSGDVPAATELRRRWAAAAGAADGPEAALAVLDDTRQSLGGAQAEEGQEKFLALHLALVDHQRASTLLAAGRPEQAVAALDGVAQAYGDVGDHDNAVRAVGLQVEALHLAGRTGDAATLGRAVADQLKAAGGTDHAATVGGVLAAVLDDAGDPDGAARARAEYGVPGDGSDDGPGDGTA